MARDTRGPVPYGQTDLRRFSLNPSHWRQARRMLAGEAMAGAVIGAAGLIGVYLVRPRGTPVWALGLHMTPALSWAVLAVGVAAAVSMLHRRLAMVFTSAVGAASLVLVIVSAVATTHHAPGPLGFTAASTVLYGVIFCANLAIGMWLVPNHIEGPAWVSVKRATREGRRRSRGRGA